MIECNVKKIPTDAQKEEARQQFDRHTKELGLKHTFTFDEMWEFLVDRRRKAQFRTDIITFEEKVKEMPENLGEDPFPLEHTFLDGLYVRQVTVPPNTLTVTKIHKQENVFFLLKGTISIVTDKGIEQISAPYTGITKAGTKRVILHHDEVVFTTVHATDKKDVEAVEEQIFADDFSGVNALEDDNIKKLIDLRNEGEL